MLKLQVSRAMVGHAEAICQILFSSPGSTKILSGFWQGMLDPFAGQMQGSKQHFGLRLGPSLAILGPVKGSGSYSSAIGRSF